MKKISFVLIALLALVAFTGCPTAHDDYDYAANPIVTCLAGGGNGWPITFTQTPSAEGAISTIEWTWDGSQNWEESEAGTVQFAVLAADGVWDGKWCSGVTVTVGGGYATSGQNGVNNVFSGLVADTDYVITILAGFDGTVKIKIDEA